MSKFKELVKKVLKEESEFDGSWFDDTYMSDDDIELLGSKPDSYEVDDVVEIVKNPSKKQLLDNMGEVSFKAMDDNLISGNGVLGFMPDATNVYIANPKNQTHDSLGYYPETEGAIELFILPEQNTVAFVQETDDMEEFEDVRDLILDNRIIKDLLQPGTRVIGAKK